MATNWETFPIKLEGGWITNQGKLEQGANFPGSATTLENFETDVQGGYTRVLGYEKFSPTEVTNTGTVKGVIAVGAQKVLAVRGDGVFESTGAAWTRVLTISAPTYDRIHYDSYKFGVDTKYVMVDGVNQPSFYNVGSSTMAYGVGFPADTLGAAYVIVFKNHIFYAVDNKLVFSAPYTDDDFNPANGAGIINMGEEITGMAVFRDNLFIFSGNHISRLSGNTVLSFQLDPVTTNTGCVNGHTIQEVGGDIMYLAADGIRYLSASERNNDFGLMRASEKIQSEFVALDYNNTIFSSITIPSKNQYRLFAYVANTPRESTKNFIGVKLSNQTAEDISWSALVGIKAYCTSQFTDAQQETSFFGSETSYVYRMETGSSFDGEDITAVFETPYLPISDPKIRKTLFKHTVYTRSINGLDLTLRVYFDYNPLSTHAPPPITISSTTSAAAYGTAVYGTSVYGSGRAEIQYYNNLMGSGLVTALRYESTSMLQSFNLNFVVLEYKTNDRR